MDVEDEAGRSPIGIRIFDLDEAAINKWWKNYKEKYSLWNNCSDAVSDALEVGGVEMPSKIVHDPQQIFDEVMGRLVPPN